MASGAVQGQHQLTAETLSERVPADERLELGDELVVPAECEVGVDAILQARELLLCEPSALPLRERLLELGKRRAAPECQCFPQPRCRFLDSALPERIAAPCGQLLELAQVEGVSIERDLVARSASPQ